VEGKHTPITSEIDFKRHAAEVAGAIGVKVRINPGNYVDKRISDALLTQKEYDEELERIRERLLPLLAICKENGTAIRIGTNHGSLSSRIMQRYGDTPEGMAESALEFGRICLAENFRNVVFSIKSSNIRVMVNSTRLLVQKMQDEGMCFPLHLGVTEAGDGEDGIIKSASGIGTLLEDGIGDTIRVSLTGAPEIEIPVALAITERYNYQRGKQNTEIDIQSPQQPVLNAKRETIAVSGIGANYPVAVLAEKENKICLLDEHSTVTGQLTDQNLPLVTIIEGSSVEMKKMARKIPAGSTQPVILKITYHTSDLLRFRVDSSIDFGSLLIDGVGDAIWPVAPNIVPEIINQTAFAILQATRTRITRTEFISCPSCGRTLFDLESTLQQVKAATQHLVGLKIAVMGCIVNGPGEMADADYGYVGAGKGLITLYKGKVVIRKNIPESEALQELLKLINSDMK